MGTFVIALERRWFQKPPERSRDIAHAGEWFPAVLLGGIVNVVVEGIVPESVHLGKIGFLTTSISRGP